MPALLASAALLAAFTHVAIASAQAHPFARAHLGDWAWYRSTLSRDGVATTAQEVRQEVVRTTQTEVVIVEVARDNLRDYDKRRTIDLTQTYQPILGGGTAKEVGRGQESVEIAGRRYATTWVAYEAAGDVVGTAYQAKVKIWYSPEAPLDGMVRRETTTQVVGRQSVFVTELAEWGRGGKGTDGSSSSLRPGDGH